MKLKCSDINKLEKILELSKLAPEESGKTTARIFVKDDDITFIFQGEFNTIRLSGKLKEFGLEHKTEKKEADATFSAYAMIKMLAQKCADTLTLEKTDRSLIVRNGKRKLTIPHHTGVILKDKHAVDITKIKIEELADAAKAHTVLSTKVGSCLLSGDTVLSVDGPNRRSCCTTKLSSKIPDKLKVKTVDGEEIEKDIGICIASRSLFKVAPLLSSIIDGDDVQVSLTMPDKEFSDFRVSGKSQLGGEFKLDIRMFDKHIAGSMQTVLSRMGTVKLTKPAKLTAETASSISLSMATEDSPSQAVIILSNQKEKGKLEIKNPDKTFQDTVEVESGCEFTVSVRPDLAYKALTCLSEPELVFGDGTKVLMIKEDDTLFMLGCLVDSSLGLTYHAENYRVVGSEPAGSTQPEEGTVQESGRSVAQSQQS